MREQSNSFYLGLMERVKEINLETSIVSLQKANDLGRELKDIKKRTF
jgi:hypothetical protein